MKTTRRFRNCSALSILFTFFFVTGAFCEGTTRLSGVASLHSLKQFHTVEDFRIGGTYDPGNKKAYALGGEGGTTLESMGQDPLRLAYIAEGTPRYDKNGEIINAVIISPYYAGDATFMYNFWYEGQKGNGFSRGAVVGPGRLIDTNRYYVVFLDALGLWGASKPSDGLGMGFPKYSGFDFVQANYRLLRDKLKIARVRLATGVSMGAVQSYIWAILHPDFVEAIMPVGGMTAGDTSPRWLFQQMTAAMKSDPIWQGTKGDYYHLPKAEHPNRGLMFGWSILSRSGLSFDLRNTQSWEDIQKEVFYWDPEGEQGVKLLAKAKDYDVNDLLYRNRWMDTFDINGHLHRIKAKTLIIQVKNDQWLRWEMAEKTARQITGAKLVGFESPLSHYAVFRGPNMEMIEVIDFMKSLEKY